MSPHKVEWEGKTWNTTEALFQALRFQDDQIREMIRKEKSPMGAKFKAKKHKDQMVVEPMSKEDLENMVKCVKLKVGTYGFLQRRLLATGTSTIFEDVSSRIRGERSWDLVSQGISPNKSSRRHLFWGGVQIQDKIIGDNHLGKIWMKEREELAAKEEK